MASMTPSTSVTSNVRQSDEIRRIIDDFSATLSKATSEIKVLTKEKAEVERAYEDLMEVNENLIKDLVRKWFLKMVVAASALRC